jgi:copper(I)-binding protein
MHTSISRVLALAFVLLMAVGCDAGVTKPTVSDAWVRLPLGADRPTAAYMTIVGGDEADALIAATSPISSDVQVHETTHGADGMGMQQVDRIEVPAGATVTLEPGGYHLMLMMPEMDGVAVGDTVGITLTFATAGDLVVQAEVRAD